MGDPRAPYDVRVPDFAAWTPSDWSALGTCVTAIVAVAAAAVASVQVAEARRLRRDQVAENARARPSIQVNAVFGDNIYFSSTPVKGVWVTVTNTGRADTNLTFLHISGETATGSIAINGLNSLVDATGGLPKSGVYARRVAGYSTESLLVKAETVTSDEVQVSMQFGHGESFLLKPKRNRPPSLDGDSDGRVGSSRPNLLGFSARGKKVSRRSADRARAGGRSAREGRADELAAPPEAAP